MNAEPSESHIICQKEIWRTCVVCGDLNKMALMRSFNKSSHLHVMIAYLKFTGSIDAARDFSNYDDRKTYECYVCVEHIDVPVRALRKIYAFPPEVPNINGKCDPDKFLRVIKSYMPLEYHSMTLAELDNALPKSRVPMTREVQKVDCSCCNILEKTRRRLKTVIENAEETLTCVRFNFAVFEELIETEKELNFEYVKESVKPNPIRNSSMKQLDHENFLLRFEQKKIKELMEETEERAVPPLGILTSHTPQLRHVNILPSYPGIPYPASPLQRLLNTPPIRLPVNSKPLNRSASRKRKVLVSSDLTQLSTSECSLYKKTQLDLQNFDSSRTFMEPDTHFSPAIYSQSTSQDQRTSDCAKEIINTKLIVFSCRDLYALISENEVNIVQDALSNLELGGLLHAYRSLTESTVYVKEIRREHVKDLWSYGLIPEHYRQRLIGLNSAEYVRNQFEKYKSALIEMNSKQHISELIGFILSTSSNSDLEIEFGKFNSGSEQLGSFCKKRTPKLEAWNSESKALTI